MNTSTESIIDISVIIPAYNAEDHIIRCLESLCEQDIPKDRYEIIVCNDGSTDKTSDLVNSFSTKYPRVTCIDHENVKPGGARNIGLSKAQGEYVIFVDADDYLIPNTLGSMIRLSVEKKLDILMGDFVIEADNESNLKYNNYYCKNHQEICTGYDFICTNTICGTAWLYLYKRKFLKSRGLKFRAGVYYEDVDFSIRALLASDRIMYVPVYFYVHCENPMSITLSEPNVRNFSDQAAALHNLQKIIDSLRTSSPITHRALSVHMLDRYYDLLRYAIQISRSSTILACKSMAKSRLSLTINTLSIRKISFYRFVQLSPLSAANFVYQLIVARRWIRCQFSRIFQLNINRIGH